MRPVLVRFAVGAVALAVVLSGLFVATTGSDDTYRVVLAMDNAVNVKRGSAITVNGFKAGQIDKIRTQDGKALVTVKVSDQRYVPLHSGTQASIVWKAAIGERIVDLVPGPEKNAGIPSGSLLQVSQDQVELDQLLGALDEPTRQRLTSLIRGLDATLKPNDEELQQVIEDAGPTMLALGQVLKAVGDDGPAIRSLVTNLDRMMQPMAARRTKLSAVVNDLTNITNQIASERTRLAESIRRLPGVLAAAQDTLSRVPDATDAAVPLLHDLRPATRKLIPVARNLSPLLDDLRPAVADLRPTLQATNRLLGRTPEMLDSTHELLPDLTPTLAKLNPMVDFLRPYTPDLVGWLSNWGAAFASYDGLGHVFRGLIQAGPSAFNDNPGVLVGFTAQPDPPPGMASDNPWTDADGGEMR